MTINVNIITSWKDVLSEEFSKPYFAKLVNFVKNAYNKRKVYPPGKLIFRAFDLCPFDKVKVVILGQDPYHRINQAEGLSFSVPKYITIPPSLYNIFKELKTDIGKEIPKHGHLIHWAEQGVLLLNSILTVYANQPGSHATKGWEQFTDAVVELLNNKRSNLVFMLWGRYAQTKGSIINRDRHFVLKTTHPSFHSAHRGFMGSKHFSQANYYLRTHKKTTIIW